MSPAFAVPGRAGLPSVDAAPGRIGARLGPDDVRTLVEIGFSALMQGLDRQAEAIFTGVVAARPAAEAGRIGLALTHLYRGGIREAVALLRALPPTDAARLYLGLALSRLGDVAEARRLLDDVARTASDPAFVETARALLAEIGPR